MFIQESALAASALAFPFVADRNVLGANERLNLAGIGVGGKGASDIDCSTTENIVALCDVDDVNAAATLAKFPNAKRFKDFRVMLEREGRHIDAVDVATPDHMHAPISIMAMEMGKHVYCQKPLAHSVFEARQMAAVARRRKVMTQMGNQGHANPAARRLVELVRGGALGRVKAVHCWTDRPGKLWPQGMKRPEDSPAVPGTLDWDLWLGVAPYRPYHPAYAPFKWRGFWDFGTGALGDMACHIMDLAFFALDLKAPTRVSAQSAPVSQEMAPTWSIIDFEFPGQKGGPPVKLTWYDGGRKPSPDLVQDRTVPYRDLTDNGTILVGEKDILFVPKQSGVGVFLSGARVEDFKSIPVTLPRYPAGEKSHHLEWIAACKGGPRALSNFDYAGPMTEAVLLGNVALRASKPIEWNSADLKVTNVPEANAYLRTEYRKGWGV